MLDPESPDFTLDGATNVLNFRLNDDFSVINLSYPNATNAADNHWSMIYDQSFFINFSSQRFIANFKYTVKDTVKKGGYKQLTVQNLEKFDSHCDKTMVGFI